MGDRTTQEEKPNENLTVQHKTDESGLEFVVVKENDTQNKGIPEKSNSIHPISALFSKLVEELKQSKEILGRGDSGRYVSIVLTQVELAEALFESKLVGEEWNQREKN